MAREVTIDQVADLYRNAFDQACNERDWKGEIDCVVPYELANLYMRAIEFMTGVKPECKRVIHNAQYMAHLTCIGYRNGPCGS